MDRQELVGLAKLAEHAERHDEMIRYVKQLVENHAQDFTQEERTLLSVAYKLAVGERRNAWRVLQSQFEKEKTRNGDNQELVGQYKAQIEQELVNLCTELINYVDSNLYKESDDNNVKVYYLKMKGDYYRYAAEIGHTDSVEKGRTAYNAAMEAAGDLPPENPNKLGLALNFSVFYYEILKEPENAKQLAQSSFDAALPTLDSLQEQAYKEATNILGLMRDNLTIWNSDDDQDQSQIQQIYQ